MKKHIKLASITLSEPPQPDEPHLVTHRLKPRQRDDCDTRSMSNADKSISTS